MELSCVAESWPIRGRFAISRGEKTEAQVIVATIRDGAHQGRGECMPYSRYGESVESVQDQMASVRRSCKNCCLPERRGTRSIAPCGILRRSEVGRPYGSWWASKHRNQNRRHTPSAWTLRKKWLRARQKLQKRFHF